MKLTPLTVNSIDYVIKNISVRSLSEVKATGREVYDLWPIYMNLIDKPFALAVYDGETPWAISYLETSRVGVYVSHFIFTEYGSKKVWTDFTKFWKRFSSKIVDDGGMIELHTVLTEKDEQVHRWYEALGFKYIQTVGATSTYIKGGKLCASVDQLKK